MVGTVLAGRYRIDGIIGEGSMGTVYRAVQEPMDRLVAIKVLRADLAADASVAAGFHSEAKAASSLSNPNTVTIHDFGQADGGTLYIAMEHLEGESLAARLRQGPISCADAAEIGAQVCRALAEAHRKNIVHGDLKPADIILTTSDEEELLIKVVDFGIAQMLRPAVAGGAASDVGTPRYMAPEQGSGGEPTAAGDLYALGVILFEAIAGKPPFDHDDPAALAELHVSHPVPTLESLHGPVPPKLATLVRSLLAKMPANRPKEASAPRSVLRALADAARQELPFVEATAVRDDDTEPFVSATARGEEDSGLGPGPEGLGSGGLVLRQLPPEAGGGKGGRRGLLITMAMVAIVAGGAIAVASWAMCSRAAAPIPAAAPPEATTPGAVDGASAVAPASPGAPPGADAPANDGGGAVVVTIQSTPEGARVNHGSEYLCTTPCRTRVDATEPFSLTLHKRGFRPATVEVTPPGRADLNVTLERRR